MQQQEIDLWHIRRALELAARGQGASLEDVFRTFTGDNLVENQRGGLRNVRSTRRTARRVG